MNKYLFYVLLREIKKIIVVYNRTINASINFRLISIIFRRKHNIRKIFFFFK